ncbi:hypothetical protein SAMN04487820_1024 [Actinopolyspora mzabensis]|uniref:Uncharacterized protein n=1 Tax=Actinopolyspora mzabensis TaxID=995066 RepID=A0A1G8WHH1_ACTMZ|nr:hypothetical protein SAMN04487820_1024 [Actinopolyspora mzabensis]
MPRAPSWILVLGSVSGSLAVLSLLLNALSGRGSLLPHPAIWGLVAAGATLLGLGLVESLRRVRRGGGARCGRSARV